MLSAWWPACRPHIEIKPMTQRHVLSFAFAAIATVAAVSGCSKSPQASSAMPASAPSSLNVSDRDVTEHVKTALQQNDTLKGFDITVITLKGDVRLIGTLGNQTQIDEALKIARNADGAHTIHDELTIKQ
jgi:hyperosmotically inducible protein